MGRIFDYDVLTNPEYQNRLVYIKTTTKGRLSYIASAKYTKDLERIKEDKKNKKVSLYTHKGEANKLMAKC